MAPETAPKKAARGRMDDLVAVAAKLFRDRGYDATSMQEIADEVGILKGSVYHYVSTKEDLLWMIVEAPLRELVDGARAILGDLSKPMAERMRETIRLHCESFERHHPHMFVITREYGETLSDARREEISALRDEYYSIWKKAITSGKRSGEVRSDIDTAVTIEAILGMVNWMFRWFKPGGRLTAASVADEFANLLERGIVAS
ncbi:MAG: TetR/AcrR family transcriptional regulator [Thermoleophilaceae bacterium]